MQISHRKHVLAPDPCLPTEEPGSPVGWLIDIVFPGQSEEGETLLFTLQAVEIQ